MKKEEEEEACIGVVADYGRGGYFSLWAPEHEVRCMIPNESAGSDAKASKTIKRVY